MIHSSFNVFSIIISFKQTKKLTFLNFANLHLLNAFVFFLYIFQVYNKDKGVGDLVDYSAEYLLPTTQSILSLHQAGYIEYLPFKGRMSPFYDNRWQHWPITEKGSGLGIFGMGKETLNLIHYQTQTLGMMTIDG